MLNKPKFLTPSINIPGQSVIDTYNYALDGEPYFNISCIIDGNVSVSHWQAFVYKLKDSVLVFQTEITEINFSPVDNKNQNNLFQEKIYLSAQDNIQDGVGIVNTEEAYCWKLRIWEDYTNRPADFIDSHEEVFYANKKPDVVLKYSTNNRDYINFEDNQVFNNRKITFKADYAQEQSIGVKKYGWRITEINNNSILLDTISKNQIYGTQSNISCDFNGFVSGFEYKIELYIETQNGYSSIVFDKNFKIDYNTQTLMTDFEIEPLESSSAILLDWENLKTTEGKYKGKKYEVYENYPITSYDNGKPNGSNSLLIDDDTEIIFEGNANTGLAIPEDAYTVISFQITKNQNTTLFMMTGTNDYGYKIHRKLSYIFAERSLMYVCECEDGSYVASKKVLENPPSEIAWYIVQLSPILKGEDEKLYVKINVTESITEGALFPSDATFPSEETFPDNGLWNKLRR